MTGLVDCNNFFVSCERTLNPSLEGRAVVVLSNNDGCVVARSNEAKKLGIRMGQPAFEIKDIINKGQVIALSGNHLLYRAISIRLHDIFREYAPSTTDYSVDEAFLDMTGIPVDALEDIGKEMVARCWNDEHIPVTIGFATTKTLAKIATEYGKKNGVKVKVLVDRDEIGSILDRMIISDLWGIGRRLAKRLHAKGIYTIGDFARCPRQWVRSEMGVTGERSWCELKGEACIDLDHVDRNLQDSVSESRTFPIDIDDFDYMRSRIAIYCNHVARRLRAMGGQCEEMCVWLTTNRFHLERGYSAPTATTTFSPPTSDSSVIATTGIALLEHIFQPGCLYKRAGVVLNKITPATSFAPTLFEDGESQRIAVLRSKRLMNAIDKVNTKSNPQVVRLAVELTKGHVGHNDGYSSSFGPAKPL
ncbi:MAG: Y-family DNA polymerase [Muribaculaceae bacterium]|nr:Y-family DNA polymerase [Muribaculaceae bacterium]